ncbi:SET domain-containing protein SmydA-8-like [Ctenocephalides felis]|uniref:SET domain-containing protein SmydA-8-like n=1 Tax=Ctenocephalides felis TaxID=7515 RepID=UPI000E6E47A2|nr:SET domain-containing protein SmydA-8-like [Ctenocephalides felis]
MAEDTFVHNKLKILTNDALGRHLVTEEAIKKGERLILDPALVIGPHVISGPVCLNCWTPVPPASFCRRCSRCDIAPLCSSCFEMVPNDQVKDDNQNIRHNLQECNAFQKSTLNHNTLINNLHVVMPLRCLLLSEQKLQEVMKMEAHQEKRRNKAIWHLYRAVVIKALYDFGLVDPEKWNEESLQRLCGILDVNTFEIRCPAGTSSTARALFPLASLMSHDCTPNAHITLDKKHHIRSFASRDIAEGTTICCTYTSIMQPTWRRREHLREGKYFECMCERCKDATEFGTHLQSLICTGCSGQVIPTNPTSPDPWSSGNSWSCLSCNKSYEATSIKALLDAFEARIAITDKTNEEALETLLSSMCQTLTPHHYLMLDVKQTLAALLRDKYTDADDAPIDALRRKTSLCSELVNVLETLEPGLSRLTGIAYYELFVATSQQANCELVTESISSEEFLSRIKSAEGMLRSAINLLIYEPDNTPEGALVKAAFQDLHLIKNAPYLFEDGHPPKIQKPRFSSFGRF